jgi:RNA polymerase sigma factor (sigma-70 family)
LAEDAAQDVFLRLARYRPFADLRDVAAFRSYLYSMTQNVCRSYLRSVLSRPEVSLDDMLATLPDAGLIDPEDTLAARDLLDGILGPLDDADRQIIRLLADGYGLPEIQEALGIGYSDAGVRVHRLRRRVRNYLSNKWLDE